MVGWISSVQAWMLSLGPPYLPAPAMPALSSAAPPTSLAARFMSAEAELTVLACATLGPRASKLVLLVCV